MKAKVSATAVVGIQSARWQLGSPLLSRLWCPSLWAFTVGQTSLLRCRSPCQRGRDVSTLVVVGPDQQGVSLMVPLAELVAWSPAASCVPCGGLWVLPGPAWVFLPSSCQSLGGASVDGFVEETRSSGESSSTEDPSRTSLGKAHGREGGTQPKKVLKARLKMPIRRFDVNGMLALLRSPLRQLHEWVFRRRLQTGAGAERTRQTEAKLWVTARRV